MNEKGDGSCQFPAAGSETPSLMDGGLVSIAADASVFMTPARNFMKAFQFALVGDDFIVHNQSLQK